MGPGRVRRRLRQRRAPRSVRDVLRPERPLPQSRRRNLRGRHGTRGPACRRPALGYRLLVLRLRPRRPSRSRRHELPPVRSDEDPGARHRRLLPVERHSRHVRPARTALLTEPPVPQRGRGPLRRCLDGQRHRQDDRAATASPPSRPTSTTTAIPDLYVACDSTPSLLYHNNHDGTFEDIGLLSGTASTRTGRNRAAWASPSPTTTKTAACDIVKTNFSDDVPNVYHNSGDGTFEDHVLQSGLGGYMEYVGWGVHLLDMDHDGRKDLLMINGHVYPEVEKTPEIRYRQPRLFYWNVGGGKFKDISAAAGRRRSTRRLSSRGSAVGDLDNDGSLEVVVSNMGAPPSLLEELRPAQELAARAARAARNANSDAMGARACVYVGGRRLSGEVQSGHAATSRRTTAAFTSASQRARRSIGSRSSGRAERASSFPEEGRPRRDVDRGSRNEPAAACRGAGYVGRARLQAPPVSGCGAGPSGPACVIAPWWWMPASCGRMRARSPHRPASEPSRDRQHLRHRPSARTRAS